MPIGPNGEPLPYPNNGATQPGGPPFDPRAMNPGVGTGPQMPPIEAVVARIQELEAELQQLVALAEQISGRGGPQPGMGGRPGPDLPPGIPQGGPPGLLA
jgi:hypothetical protein